MANTPGLAACLDIDLGDLWSRIEAAGPRDEGRASFDPASWQDIDESSERSLSQSDQRRTFIALYGWAVPTREAIAAIGAFVGQRKVLEVCAGGGLWARLLSGSGVDLIATDTQPVPAMDYFPVEAGEAEAAVIAHPECEALLLCWPPLRDDCAFRALRTFRGDRVVYVGDARFTAEKQFHALLRQEWTLQERILIPVWPGLDDYAYLYTRAPVENTPG